MALPRKKSKKAQPEALAEPVISYFINNNPASVPTCYTARFTAKAAEELAWKILNQTANEQVLRAGLRLIDLRSPLDEIEEDGDNDDDAEEARVFLLNLLKKTPFWHWNFIRIVATLHMDRGPIKLTPVCLGFGSGPKFHTVGSVFVPDIVTSIEARHVCVRPGCFRKSHYRCCGTNFDQPKVQCLARYCCRRCQKLHWIRGHREQCRRK